MKQNEINALLEEAKKRYPIGTRFRVAHIKNIIRTVVSHNFNQISNDDTHLNINVLEEDNQQDFASIYTRRCGWAEIVSLPKVVEQPEFKILSYKNKVNNIVWKLAENGRYYSGDIYLAEIQKKYKLIHSVMNKDGNTFDIGDEIVSIKTRKDGRNRTAIIERFGYSKVTGGILAFGNHFYKTGVSISKIEHFIEKEPEFLLPEKWFVLYSNREEFNMINDHFLKNWGYVTSLRCGYFTDIENNHNNWISDHTYFDNTLKKIAKKGYIQLTFEQFKKYVLKEELSPIQLATEQHPKLANIDEPIIIAQGHADQLKLTEQGIKSIVIPNETLLEKAKRLYPVDTKFKRFFCVQSNLIVTVDSIPVLNRDSISVKCKEGGNRFIYNDGTWAEIIEEVVPKVGDRFRIIYNHARDTTFPSVFIISEIIPGKEGDYQVIKFKQFETQIGLSSVLSTNIKLVK